MNKKFLNKVLGQIMSETITSYRGERIIFSSPFSLPLLFPLCLFPPLSFSRHCKNLYALDKEEMVYIWNKYKDILESKYGPFTSTGDLIRDKYKKIEYNMIIKNK